MKNFKKVISAALVATMVFSFTACGKKVVKFDEDDLIDLLEDELDWEETVDYRENDHYELWGTNFDDVDDPYIYELDYYLNGSSVSDDDYDVYVSYAIFDSDEEAEEYFVNYYNTLAADKKDISKKYSKGNMGFFIDSNEDDFFHAYYYNEDMVFEVDAFNEDGVKVLKSILKTLELPTK